MHLTLLAPDPGEVIIPGTPIDLFLFELELVVIFGTKKAAKVDEILSIGHSLEVGRLITGDTFFNEPAKTIHLCRSDCDHSYDPLDEAQQLLTTGSPRRFK